MTTTTAPTPKWRYTPTIMDGAVVRYDFSYLLEVNASRNGVSVDGTAPIMGPWRLAQFIAILKQAEEAHKVIKNGDHAAAEAWVEKMNKEVEI